MAKATASVDDYIAGFPPEVQTRLRAVRDTIRRSAPHANESISYGMPAYQQDGVLIYFAGYKEHVGLYPLSASIRQELGATLTPYDSPTAKATARFPYDRPMPRALIARIVKLRLRENLTRLAASTKAKRKATAAARGKARPAKFRADQPSRRR